MQEFPKVAICLLSSKGKCSIWTIWSIIVIVGAFIYASSVLYVGFKFSVFGCVSCYSAVSGHSVDFKCSAVWLILVAKFPKHGLECWKHSIITSLVVSCHVQSVFMYVVWYFYFLVLPRQEQQLACCCVVHSSPWVSSVRFHEVLLGNSLPSWMSSDLLHLGHTIQYCSTMRSLIIAPV